MLLELLENRDCPTVAYAFFDASNAVLIAGTTTADSLTVGDIGGNVSIDGADSGVPVASVDHATADGVSGSNTLAVEGGHAFTVSSVNAGSAALDYPIAFTSIQRLVGGDGDDSFNFSAPSSSLAAGLDGGDGVNLLDFTGTRTAGVVVNLLAGTASGAGPIANIQNVTGTSGNDVIFGDNAANVLRGGGGNDILCGNGGDDDLYGDGGRNLLIGGTGTDTLHGGTGGDILVGAACSYTSLTPLNAILTEWVRTDVSYSVRVAQIFGTLGGGINGAYHLNSSTVDHDTAADVLYGNGTGGGWCLRGINATTPNAVAGETVTVV